MVGVTTSPSTPATSKAPHMMEIDTAEKLQLTDEQKQAFRRDGKCFRCGVKGHRAKDHQKQSFERRQ